MDTCLFCKIVAGEIPATKIYEDEHVLAFMDIKPVSAGHALVVPKKHTRNLIHTDSETLEKTVLPLSKIVEAIKKATNADGVVVSTNNEEAAGQVIFHFHWHIIPRHHGDGLTPWPHHDANPEDLASLAEKIKSVLL